MTHSKYNLRAAAVIDVVFVDICRGTITQKYFHSITEKKLNGFMKHVVLKYEISKNIKYQKLKYPIITRH